MTWRDFIEFLTEYFRGPTGGAEYREIFICKGDPRGGGARDRGVVWVKALDNYLSTFINGASDLKKWNIYMGIGFVIEAGLIKPEPDKVLYDRLSFDLDYEESPGTAVAEAIAFGDYLYRKYKVKPLVFETGFKGAHVVIPLAKPINWDSYQLLWRHLYDQLPPATRKMVDLNMLQWNRVDRVPLTYNVKENQAKYCRIVYPEEYRWGTFTWSSLDPLDPGGVSIVKIEIPEIVKAKTLAKKTEKKWIWRIVEAGLPEGRKRFIFQVLIPFLVNIKNASEEEVMDTCHRFIENSCKNHNACGKIYDSWLRSAIRSARNSGFKGYSLSKFLEKNPDLKEHIEPVLGDAD